MKFQEGKEQHTDLWQMTGRDAQVDKHRNGNFESLFVLIQLWPQEILVFHSLT